MPKRKPTKRQPEGEVKRRARASLEVLADLVADMEMNGLTSETSSVFLNVHAVLVGQDEILRKRIALVRIVEAVAENLHLRRAEKARGKYARGEPLSKCEQRLLAVGVDTPDPLLDRISHIPDPAESVRTDYAEDFPEEEAAIHAVPCELIVRAVEACAPDATRRARERKSQLREDASPKWKAMAGLSHAAGLDRVSPESLARQVRKGPDPSRIRVRLRSLETG